MKNIKMLKMWLKKRNSFPIKGRGQKTINIVFL